MIPKILSQLHAFVDEERLIDREWYSFLDKLSQGIETINSGAAKAWVNFAASGGVATIRSSFNVSSITVHATGQFSINFTVPFASANYAWSGSAGGGTSGGVFLIIGPNTVNPTASSFRFAVVNQTFSGVDCPFVSIVFFGDQ